METRKLCSRWAWIGLGLLSCAPWAAAQSAQWLQWGGPKRDFMVEAKGLANSWPAEGPRRLWKRDLGEGHSSIIADGGRLFTMYRPPSASGQRGEEESVIALDAATGRTVWEHKYPSSGADIDFSRGAGPHSTPLIVEGRLFAAGSRKEFFALDKRTGKLLWSHDLMKEFSAAKPGRGFSCSPIAYKQMVILPVGGPGQGVMAFRQQDGAPVWKSHSFQVAPASPILINVNGQGQLVAFGGSEIMGLNPEDGSLLWSHPHKTEYGLNISTPVWGSDNLLFISSAYDAGSRALQLSQANGKTEVRELWFTNQMRVHHGTVIRLGDTVYGASGDFGPVPTTAINVKTGAIVWRDRSFARATFLHADGKLIIMDEDGNLGLATASPAGLKVLARAEVTTKLSWTVPTLVGTTLYVRDRRGITALHLGA